MGREKYFEAESFGMDSCLKIWDDPENAGAFAAEYNGETYHNVAVDDEIVLTGNSVGNTAVISTDKNVAIRLRDLSVESMESCLTLDYLYVSSSQSTGIYAENAKLLCNATIYAQAPRGFSGIAAKEVVIEGENLVSETVLGTIDRYPAVISGLEDLKEYAASVKVDGAEYAYGDGTFFAMDGKIAFYLPEGHVEVVIWRRLVQVRLKAVQVFPPSLSN